MAVINVKSSSAWPEDLNTEWDEHARTGFPKYAIVHSRGMGNEAGGCIIHWSLEPCREQTAEEMVRSGIEDVGRQGFHQSKAKKSGEGFYYRKMFRGDEVMECPVLQAKEMVR